MGATVMDEVRAADPAERLLEESWRSDPRPASSRELLVEMLAGLLFLCIAAPLAAAAFSAHHTDFGLAAVLVLLYALASRMIKFPIGAGYVVPSYLVLVPMLLLLPPGAVPLLTAAALVLGTAGQVAMGRARAERIALAVPDAWHALGPAAVLLLAGHTRGVATALVYVAAFAAGCLVDLASATVRERAILGIAQRLQTRVIMMVWLIDACFAPLGLLVAHAVRADPRDVLLILPLNAVLLLVSRDRNAHIARAQQRMSLLARERTRLQTAVGRLGEALAAKLDLEALSEIVLRGSLEALDAAAGRLTLDGVAVSHELEIGAGAELAQALRVAGDSAAAGGHSIQVQRDGVWALALPFGFSSDAGGAQGAVAVARPDRPFLEDEQALMHGLVERAREATADIVAHQKLRAQAMTDALTGLGNRRKLAGDIDRRAADATEARPLALILFDLDGFKGYNDTFGHQAGDELLARLAGRLAAAVAAHGEAYRLGGDEFCALLEGPAGDIEETVAAAALSLSERADELTVGASHGAVRFPLEATDAESALRLADERMYANKRGRPSLAGDQAREVLLRLMQARHPSLHSHSAAVAALSRRVGRRLRLAPERLEELVRAAELHDIGRLAVAEQAGAAAGTLEGPGAPGRQAVLGEQIVVAAPTLRSIARVIRATAERWDGRGGPDGLMGDAIPLAARVVAVCDAYAEEVRACRAPERALAELERQAGHRFDAAIVKALALELREQGHGMAGPWAHEDVLAPCGGRVRSEGAAPHKGLAATLAP